MHGMAFSAKINAVTRLVLVASVIAWVLFRKTSIIITASVCLLVLVVLWKNKETGDYQAKTNAARAEGFQDMQRDDINRVRWTRPTTKNPLMNVLLPEIKDNPKRLPAAPAYNAVIETEINAATQKATVDSFNDRSGVDERLFRDLGDSLEFDRSMIGFNATANTQIPNDQGGFADYCYGGMQSAKEGSKEALAKGMGPRVIDGDQ